MTLRVLTMFSIPETCHVHTFHSNSSCTDNVWCSTAVSCGHIPVVKMLLYHGIDTSLVDNDGQIAAELTDSPEMTRLLERR